ncbi:Putative vacuolar protein sorting-associated protein [Seminavis robusta]|uniref:Vacuolar protein sorting-associated protein n=1 Tax=Seminavis robusta TaxID=568900 RepID=A0A9N8E4E9_9STRA|nr:Putative vacuolar protein sorting-associated protein [Seminavis robusta]|eukprot:Sro490_g153480.1 Putative vacuolar protein sorting-associated protein (5475) ;mRNA; r:10516-27099
MFERYLTDVLTKQFGHLLEDVDPSKLSLSAWNGSLVLEDVFLRPDALDSFVAHCPLEVAFGRVGRLELQVPWSLVGSQLWSRKTTKSNATGSHKEPQDPSLENGKCVSIVLSDVNILLTPRRKTQNASDEATTNENDDNSVETTEKMRERKERIVQEMIDAQLLSRVALSSQKTSRWKWVQDWISSLLSKISITSKNIHIRYEDPGHSMGFVWNNAESKTTRRRRYRKPFAIGITLREFNVTNRSGKEERPPEIANSSSGSGLEATQTDLTSANDGETSMQSSLSGDPIQHDDVGDQEEKEKESMLEVTTTVASAVKVAIYWDSNGCTLVSEQTAAKEGNPASTKRLRRQYVNSAFSVLNGGNSIDDESFLDGVHYSRPHTYLLDPTSPSVQFDVVSLPTEAPPTTDDTGSLAPSHARKPSVSLTAKPSSVNITMPPTLFSISRQTLEDIGYIRKSLDVWVHAKKGILSDKTLKRLAGLRPDTNAIDNPRGWWKYAAEATMALIKAGRNLDASTNDERENEANSTIITTQTSLAKKRQSGWIRLARALAARKQYVALYKEFFSSSDEHEKGERHDTNVFGPFIPLEQRRERTHQSILLLEDQLTVHEISAFRIAAYKEMAQSHQDETNDAASPRWLHNTDSIVTSHETTYAYLTMGHRYQMFVEMAQALDTETLNTEILNKEIRQRDARSEQRNSTSPTPDVAFDPTVWKVALSCTELSLQVNDKQRTTAKEASPIARLSCACVLESDLFLTGSWKAEWSVAALAMQDLTDMRMAELSSYGMKTLIGPKVDSFGKSDPNRGILCIDGESFQENMRVSVSRTVEWHMVEGTARQIATATDTRVRLSPLEIVYSTVPFEALSRVLASVKTPELADDYHRMAGRVYEWRERQKRRLLQALAHESKKIFVFVDISAPVLLIPESVYRADSPLLVLDLGRLHFSNATDAKKADGDCGVPGQYHDVWSLALTNIQVQCSTTQIYRQKDLQKDLFGASGGTSTKSERGPQQVVENFSLDFSIYTKVAQDEMRVKISAVLPKLIFNVTSSSVRLISRLRSQWSQRKQEMTTSDAPKHRNSSVSELPTYEDRGEKDLTNSENKESINVKQHFEFYFSAPTISMKLANDADNIPTFAQIARDVAQADNPHVREIVTVSIRGVGGSYVLSSEGSRISSTRFQAKLHSLHVLDHYQSAGKDFEQMLSSFDPSNADLNGNRFETPTPQTGKDLVSVEYESVEEPDTLPPEALCDTLSIRFHELYVEWNPETIAAIQKALRTPRDQQEYDQVSSSENALLDEFFDAEEALSGEDADEVDADVFFDALEPAFVDASSPLARLTRQTTLALLSSPATGQNECSVGPDRSQPDDQTSQKPFEMIFMLTKLRVNFNKESRHRRLFAAEMDRTYIAHKTLPGKSITTAKLGNLVFSDPSSDDNETLYAQILGLQNSFTGTATSPLSSLLEMELVTVSKERQTVARRGFNGLVDVASRGVSLCYEDGSVRGFDMHVSAHLSPMRFVYLSQLWSEIVDFFFEGILGYEVLGSERPSTTTNTPAEIEDHIGKTSLQENNTIDDDPYGVSFTVIDIVIDSPEVVFPVTYRSPHFLKLQAASIKLSNYFECKSRSYEIARWHNNYNISFEALRISSWNGSEVSHSKKKVGAAINVRWPTGPCAPLEDPKWNVTCRFESLDFILSRDDYALLQDVISFNLGEESRHLYEWHALQELHPDELEKYKQSIMVHYGYDTKDVAPTTYSISLTIPMVSVKCETQGGSCVAIAQCSNFSWKMTKLADCISRQTVDCHIKLVHPTKLEGGDELLLSSKGADSLPALTYASTTDASGNHIKSLEIRDSCIYVVYPAWTAFANFFSELPAAEVFTPEQVRLSMQIGDRWYKIADSPKQSDTEASPRQFSWIGREERYSETTEGIPEDTEPSYQFRILLSSPHIIISSSPTETETISLVLRLSHLDYLYKSDGDGTFTKSLFVHNLELYTSAGALSGDDVNSESPLIHPWCFSATQSSCTKQFCNCDAHSTKVACDILQARISYCDMVNVVNVCLGFVADIRQARVHETASAATTSTSQQLNEAGSIEVDSNDGLSKTEMEPRTPNYQFLTIDLNGFELLLVDDSGRQFVTSQELIMFSVGKILFCREDNLLQLDRELQELTTQSKFSRRMVLCLQGVDLLDCLQPDQSQFRLLATSRWGNFDGREADDTRVSISERMSWESFTMQKATWGYEVSKSLTERTNPECFVDLSLHSQDPLDAVILRSFEDGVNLRSYSVAISSFMMQYNPSTVIALQRFGGRFRKQAVKSIDSFNEEIDKLMQTSSDSAEVMEVPSNEKIKLDVEVERLALCLNKEHQNRRLLRVVLENCTANLSSDSSGMLLEGGVKDVKAWDCNVENQQVSDENLCILRTASSDDEFDNPQSFLVYRFCTFTGPTSGERHDLVPPWLRSHVVGSDGSTCEIDDFLEVQMGTVEITYLRERTEEIIDYLQHGLPGKGMGATSKAAQGFIEKRIRTKSFLLIGISSPVIMIPREEHTSNGMQLRLGDIDVKSWFEGGTATGRIDEFELSTGERPVPQRDNLNGQGQSDWWRMLSLQISHFTAGVYEHNGTSGVDALNEPLDVSLVLQKSAWQNRKMSLRCWVSLVEMTMKYSQYCLLSAVVDGNVGKDIDKEKWDNIEKAYDQEVEAEGHNNLPVLQPRPVEYASGARHVRFGVSSKGERSPGRSRQKIPSAQDREGIVDLQVTLDGFHLKFHRDDPVDGSLPYDMALLKIHMVEVSINNSISEDYSFQLALYRVYLFDLGEEGRIARELFQLKRKNQRLAAREPCAFAILVEGYSIIQDDADPRCLIGKKGNNEPQLVVTVDQVPSSSIGAVGSQRNQMLNETDDPKVTVAKVVLNYLSVNALIRPFTELASFLALSWPSSQRNKSATTTEPAASSKVDAATDIDAKKEASQKNTPSTPSSCMQVKLTAHYPRVFFVADECDPHSRALVLRGLAVVNAGRTIKRSPEILYLGSHGEEISTELVVDAQLHSLESYINPDVNRALRLKERHHLLLEGFNLPLLSFLEESNDEEPDFDFDELGVALLQAVTAGIEYKTTSRSRFPSKRFLCVNIEPISTMVSFEDLQLLELVYNRWVKGRQESEKPDEESQPSLEAQSKSIASEQGQMDPRQFTVDASTYDVVFSSRYLGLGLRKEDGCIVVDAVDAQCTEEVLVGDILVRIDREQVPQAPLESIVQQLAAAQRPLSLTFNRRNAPILKDTTALATVDYQVDAGDLDVATESQSPPCSQGNQFTIVFKSGIPNGLILEQSCLVSIPVVSHVDPSCASRAVLPGGSSQHPVSQRYPVAGLLVYQLNGQDITASNFSEALGFILMNGISEEPLEPSMNGSDSYAITFMEVDSSSWGYLDSFDLSLQGAALAFIDDLNGKDMPMLRGTLSSVETHLRSGVGIETGLLERIKELPFLAQEPSSAIEDHNSVSLKALARTTIEYFHPRKALYEPLLEPAQFCLKYDCHSGDESKGHPSQLALELSDGASGTGDAHVICLNVSVSSAEVIAKALREWKTWRKMVEDMSTLSFSDVSQSSIRQGMADPMTSGKEVLQSSYAASVKDFEASAAQAAYRFAQKRGAERSGKGESSKPFVFQNRTGVSIAFVQENANEQESHSFSKRRKPQRQSAFVGEYFGLDKYDRSDIIELADGSDSKFQMDFLTSALKPEEATKKIRTYEGKFPSLRVAIQSIAGVTIETLLDLQVQRAGSWIRSLSVRKSMENFSVPILWEVRVEDNRRILTLSSAVRIVSLNSSVIEVGVKVASATHLDPAGNSDVDKKRTQSNGIGTVGTIQFVGSSLPDSPFYLPLWLAMRLESIQIYVRPKFPGLAQYRWGHQSVLTLQLNSLKSTPFNDGTEWIWKETLDEALESIQCEAKDEDSPPAFLSCFTSSQVSSDLQFFQGSESEGFVTGVNEILSVSVDTGLSIRNLLPIGIEFQAGHTLGNGSPMYEEDVSSGQKVDVVSRSLRSGESAEVYACNFKAKETLAARFRIKDENKWTAWTLVSSPSTAITDSEPDQSEPGIAKETKISAFQTNVHVEDDFGVPIVIGVRVIPKVAKKSDWNRSNIVCYGVDVVVYAEFWISNLTSLPLAFGCPRHQIYEDGKDDENNEDATKFSAEAALMEMASVLELGENGTELDTRNADRAATAGDTLSIPHQESRFVSEEVFEYEELTQQALIVKRQWFAAENYWNLLNGTILEVEDGASWQWLDHCWKIDTAGGTDAALGGWESCKDLLGVGDGPFSAHRQFESSHPFRRRRFFRTRGPRDEPENGKLLPGLQAFHQPIRDSFSTAQLKARKKRKKRKRKGEDPDTLDEENKVEVQTNSTYSISVRCGDGRWSVPATVASIGSSHGTLQVFASRWPSLTNILASSPVGNLGGMGSTAQDPSKHTAVASHEYGMAPLKPTLYELSYQVSDIEGEWGDFSRHVLVSARFSMRNDSKDVTLEIKQSGARNDSALRLKPGEIAPFYWADFRLPRLVCVRPVEELSDTKVYKWSGGFDACKLGMAAVLIRQAPECQQKQASNDGRTIRTIRTLVELRPGTGGTGINISFKDEREDGEGALFRIENRSSFSVWLSQDGVLADPSTTGPNDIHCRDGDLISPGECKSFGLDVPYRQGKYAHRQAATMSELLHIRVGLAPLSSRAGIESTKVIGLSIVGESIRLKPFKLVKVLSLEQRKSLENVRVLGITTADGPTRVLKFCMMALPTMEPSLQSVLRDSVLYEPPTEPSPSGPYSHAIGQSASVAESLLLAGKLPNESDAKRQALFGGQRSKDGLVSSTSPGAKGEELESTIARADTRYSIRVSFGGFLISLIDSSPSEICTISINHINAMAKWNNQRTSDASFLMSIGWLQVDNQIPSAPFPVALCPATDTSHDGEKRDKQKSEESKAPNGTPLLFVGIEFAPKHSSGIVCIKSATIAPRSLEVSLDLAFLVRLQRFVSCVQAHFQQTQTQAFVSGEDLQQGMASQLQLQRATPLPDLAKTIEAIKNAVATGVGRQQVYFGAFAVLNFTIFLSVAPARALTAAQAATEGMEAAAIHKAVRKGDFNLGRITSSLGVVVGKKNVTARAVAMGVMKSIVVDALIRMDGASLNLSGAFLRNQIFYAPQLATYMSAHYMYSMRQNVPAMLGSMAAIGNPLGLFRGIGDGVHDFVNEPVKGLKKSIQKLDPQYMVDGVARGTGSLARHTVGGFADSAALLTSTFSKNMAVLTLDRRYAQKRDRGNQHLRYEDHEFFILAGVESGFVKLAQGFIEGVTGVVRAPIRGAEKRGFEGFAKGLGKGLLGLLVKPMIGISDAATDVFIGVKTSVEGGEGHHIASRPNQVRPRRALYGRDKHVRLYDLGDAAASALMYRTRLGGQRFLSHLDMHDRVALLSDKRLLLLDSEGKELLLVKFKHISNVEVHEFEQGSWSILVMLNSPRENGSEVEVITCKDRQEAHELCAKIKEGMSLLDQN